jgi:hypothetical protein
MRLIRSTMAPRRASCAWSTELAFWRPQQPNTGFPACPVPLDISVVDQGDDISYSYAGALSLDLFGVERVGVGCASNPYVSGPFNQVRYVDVWKALADGVWTSSMVIAVRLSGTASPSPTYHPRIRVVPYGFAPTSPPAQYVGFTIPTLQANCLNYQQVATITVYDNGVFTLA